MSDDGKKNLYNELFNAEIPFAAVSNQIHIEMFSNRKLTVEGSFTVLEYTDELITLKLKKGTLAILGVSLSITSVNEERMSVVGHILNVSFDG